jgi:hypothetical protein
MFLRSISHTKIINLNGFWCFIIFSDMPRTRQIKKDIPRRQLVSQRIARKQAAVTTGPSKKDYAKKMELFYPIPMSKNEISQPPKDMPASRVAFYKKLHEERERMGVTALVDSYHRKAQ